MNRNECFGHHRQWSGYENGIVITLPEQKLDPSKEPQIHFENNTDVTIYLSYMNLTVDGELIQEGAHNTADGGGCRCVGR